MLKQLPRLLILLVIAIGLAAPARAQTTQPTMTILRVLPGGDGPAGGQLLDIYFTLRNSDNRPMTGSRFDTVRVTVGDATVDADKVEPATSPIKIALLLDASGSMRPFMEDVHKAAVTAVQRAPENAGIAVFKFADVPLDQLLLPLSSGRNAGFNTDKQLVASDINNVQAVPNGPTCLYNAAFKALDYLSTNVAAASGDRSAVILFTDGKDERAGAAGPCSQRTIDDVIQRARSDQLVPIHTIGFCSAADCKNIDRPTLERMAFNTGGFSVAGAQSDLGRLFSDIIDGLSSQWVAHVEVFPTKGPQQATLNVTVEGDTAPIAGGFTFDSPVDRAGKPTFSLKLDYDDERDLYLATLQIENPRTVKTVTTRVFDKKRGVYVTDADAHYDAASMPSPFEIPPTNLEAEREYCIQIEATDLNDKPIKTDKGSVTLAEQCGTYEPRLGFTVNSYKADYDQGTLQINFSVKGAGKQVLQMEGEITDAKSSEMIGTIARTVLAAGQQQLVVPLPARLRELADNQREFRVGLRLIAGDSNPIEPSRAELFVPPPAPRRGLGDVLRGVFGNPIVLISLAAILLIAGAAVLYARRARGRMASIPDPGPYSPLTGRLGQGGAAAALPLQPLDRDVPTERLSPRAAGLPTLELRIVTTADPAQIRSEQITSFPCVIGRGTKGVHVQITGDPDISRSHTGLSYDSGAFYVTDLGSANGTSIAGTPLAPNKPFRITGKISVGLSPRTTLEIEPLSTGPAE